MDVFTWPFLAPYFIGIIFFVWFTSLKENILKMSRQMGVLLAIISLVSGFYVVNLTLWMIASFENSENYLSVFLYGYGVVIIFIMFDYRVFRRTRERKRIKEQEMQRIIGEHIATLSLKRKQLWIADEYGVINPDPWVKEINRFYANVLFPRVGECRYIVGRIENMVKDHLSKSEPSKNVFSEAMNPYEYERYCADLLCDMGWMARATKASGDQGCDVIAEKNGLKIVLQCKLYTKPVGNKAVQEVYAAKQHEQATHAAVVTNQTYTRSARQIASTTGVAILHHTQIKDWANSLKNK